MFDQIANILAMIFSLIGVVMLTKAALAMGGEFGKSLKVIVVGIFLAVFVHAGFELAAAYELMSEEVLMFSMGILLSTGSLAFAYAGYSTLKEIQ